MPPEYADWCEERGLNPASHRAYAAWYEEKDLSLPEAAMAVLAFAEACSTLSAKERVYCNAIVAMRKKGHFSEGTPDADGIALWRQLTQKVVANG